MCSLPEPLCALTEAICPPPERPEPNLWGRHPRVVDKAPRADAKAIWDRVASYPPEIASLIIDACIGTPTIRTPHQKKPARYAPEMELFEIPRHFRREFRRRLRQKWLRSTKEFMSGFHFVLANVVWVGESAFADSPHVKEWVEDWVDLTVKLPRRIRPHRGLNLTGLERIELNIPTWEYFPMFKVTVPPWPAHAMGHWDPGLFGAGTYLAHVRHLTLRFTSSDPWYNIEYWCTPDTDADPELFRCRPNTCNSGLVLDWILTYAWHHGYLQSIPHITLAGDIQPWVADKWAQVFAGQHEDQENVAGWRRIDEIEHHMRPKAGEPDQEWDPVEHYPPKCKCKVNYGDLGRTWVL